MKRKMFSRCCYTLAFVLGLVGAGCLAKPYAVDYMANSYHPRITTQSIAESNRSHDKVRYEGVSVKAVNLSREIKARNDSNHYQEQGELIVPRVGLNLPIYSGTGNDMMLGAGTGNSDKMGEKHDDYVLFGHHMKNKRALFSPLYDHARTGMYAYVTDLHRVYAYKLISRQVINQDDVGVMGDNHQPILRLITCTQTVGGNERLMLTGRLRKAFTLNKAPNKLKRDIQAPCNNHDVLKGY